MFANDVNLVNSGPVDQVEGDLANVARWTQNCELELNATMFHVLNTLGLPVQVTTTAEPTVYAQEDQMPDLGILVSFTSISVINAWASQQKARGLLF
ncbi:unnamed protein product [Echinostoma caproni]|uniref:Calponin-homology (CH) domain-containing protein n=1 Tax=Echinostoma caproni TaxID=27848 RepID=A0A183ARP0_9TREM|nr:unnamed protein product [Echinostoma caproni]